MSCAPEFGTPRFTTGYHRQAELREPRPGRRVSAQQGLQRLKTGKSGYQSAPQHPLRRFSIPCSSLLTKVYPFPARRCLHTHQWQVPVGLQLFQPLQLLSILLCNAALCRLALAIDVHCAGRPRDVCAISEVRKVTMRSSFSGLTLQGAISAATSKGMYRRRFVGLLQDRPRRQMMLTPQNDAAAISSPGPRRPFGSFRSGGDCSWCFSQQAPRGCEEEEPGLSPSVAGRTKTRSRKIPGVATTTCRDAELQGCHQSRDLRAGQCQAVLHNPWHPL